MAKQKTHNPITIETVNISAAAVDIGSREQVIPPKNGCVEN
jgi:hypothetical protein